MPVQGWYCSQSSIHCVGANRHGPSVARGSQMMCAHSGGWQPRVAAGSLGHGPGEISEAAVLDTRAPTGPLNCFAILMPFGRNVLPRVLPSGFWWHRRIAPRYAVSARVLARPRCVVHGRILTSLRDLIPSRGKTILSQRHPQCFGCCLHLKV